MADQETNKDIISHVDRGEDIKPSIKGDLSQEEASMEDIKAAMNSKKEKIAIHSMPGKFVAGPSKHTSTSSSAPSKKVGAGNLKKIILIVVVLLVVVAGGIAGTIWFFQSRENQNIVVNQNTNQNQNTNSNQNTNTNNNQNTNQNTNTNDNSNTNNNFNFNINQNVNNNQNTNQNTNTNDNNNSNNSLDSDGDGLTYEEELLFSSSVDLEDTDRDGYSDGQEILNLYNPSVPGGDLLNSGFVTKFMNGARNYSLFRPKVWTVQSVGGSLDDTLILPNSESGESFEIKTIENSNSYSLTEALNNLNTELGLASDYQNYSLDGESAYRSKDKTKVLVVYNNYIYIISHNLSSLGQINYATVFEMMLNSFEWFEAPEIN